MFGCQFEHSERTSRHMLLNIALTTPLWWNSRTEWHVWYRRVVLLLHEYIYGRKL